VPRRGLPSAAALRGWARAASAAEVTLRIVGSREARRLNSRFRRKPAATNVLSFPYGGARGDVVLCHPLIAREARAQGKTLAAHYAHLVVHGVLHLRGYDHEKKRDASRMERQELRILRRIGFADPYALE
jgi:probable rRNA maturation factor